MPLTFDGTGYKGSAVTSSECPICTPSKHAAAAVGLTLPAESLCQACLDRIGTGDAYSYKREAEARS